MTVEAVFIDAISYRKGKETLVKCYFRERKGERWFVTTSKAPSGERSALLNYLYDQKLKTFDLVEIGEKIYKTFTRISFPEVKNLKKAALDIEVSNPYGFPSPDRDPIISLAINDKVFLYKDKNNILGDEKIILKNTRDFLNFLNPSILFTYNGSVFDIPYIKKRAKLHNTPFYFGPFKEELRFIHQLHPFTGKGVLHIPGTIEIDICRIEKNYLPMIDGTLEKVSEFFEISTRKKIDSAEIYKLVEKNEREKIRFHNISDVKATYKLGEMLMPLLYYLSDLAYTTLTLSLLVQPSKLAETIIDTTYIENKLKVPRRRTRIYQKVKKKYEVTKLYGIYESVDLIDLKKIYLEELLKLEKLNIRENQVMIVKTAEKIKNVIEKAKGLDRKSQFITNLVFLKLAKSLYDNLCDKNSPHRDFYLARIVKNKVSRLKFNNIIYKNSETVLYKTPYSANKAFISTSGFVFYDVNMGKIYGKFKKPSMVSGYTLKLREKIIENIFKESSKNLHSIFIKGVKDIRKAELKDFAIKIKRPRERKEIIKKSKKDVIIEELEKRYGIKYTKDAEILVVKTKDGWVDISKEKVRNKDIDFKYYEKELSKEISEKILEFVINRRLEEFL